MGWLFYTDRRVKTYADEKAEITRLCTFETDTRKTALLKACGWLDLVCGGKGHGAGWNAPGRCDLRNRH